MDKSFLKKIWLDKSELLKIVREERQSGEDFSYNFKMEIEADIKLRKNKRDKKKDEKLVWDSTLFNTHSALVARSYQAKNTIKIKKDKDWIEREVEMLNNVLNEDNNSAIEKAQKYYLYVDKYDTWIAIRWRIGWDWVYKRNITSIVNPLTWIMDPNWDYFLWQYKFTWFFGIESKAKLKKEWYDVDNLLKTYSEWAIDTKERMQRLLWLMPDFFEQDLTDIYYHFTNIDWKRIYTKTASLDTVLLEWWFIEPNSSLEEKNPEAIMPPFAFYYRKPDRDNPFWDRIANYIRDVQLQKAEIANLRLNKMRAELYPMYIYNSDLVSGKDLSFWFNKWIPVKMWMWGQQFNIWNVMTPVPKDLRVDTSFQVEASLDRQVEKSTSIWEVVQWTTPSRKETLWTNNLIQTNTDVNLQINEEIHSIWDEQWIKFWFGWYYQNFKDWDKKLVYAWSQTGQSALMLKRKDFIYEWNLSLSLEWSLAREDRLKKELAATVQVTPLIMADLNPAAKVNWQRFLTETAWIPDYIVNSTIFDTPQMMTQKLENESLKENIFVPITPNDDHEQHLIAMWSVINTDAFEAHKISHLIEYTKNPPLWPTAQDQNQENAMMNSAMSQWMAQAWSTLQSL